MEIMFNVVCKINVFVSRTAAIMGMVQALKSDGTSSRTKVGISFQENIENGRSGSA
jgi:hypothetical protein